ncbi:MAG: type II and III secretion system protein family protein [Pseudomonadota bacterium]
MSLARYVGTVLLGLSLMSAASPDPVEAQTLRVQKGTVSRPLLIEMNQAVVVESEVPFAELSIANPAIADISTLSDRTIYLLGKAPGRTALTLLGADGRLITNVTVRVTPDLSEFKERLQQILPGERIEVRTANDGIVLSGVVSSAARLDRALALAERYAPERVSNLMTVGGTQQVMLKVRFAEMERSVSKSLGASIGASGTVADNLGINGGNNVFSSDSNINNALDGNTATTIASANERNGQFALGFTAGAVEFAVLIEALESKGVVRTLAEPNLIALSGQEASFLAGGEYPVPVSQDDGVVTVEFKPFGIELTFTPRVVDRDIINLQLSAAVSGLDPSVAFSTTAGFSINGFRRREVSSVVEMRDGESFAIAGLLEDDFTDLSGQVPWLGDIPVLGALFRSASYERNQSELVIIVTPHLVTPVQGDALSLPTDRIRPPTEAELFLFGKTVGDQRPRGAAGEVASQDFTGSYGYVME